MLTKNIYVFFQVFFIGNNNIAFMDQMTAFKIADLYKSHSFFVRMWLLNAGLLSKPMLAYHQYHQEYTCIKFQRKQVYRFCVLLFVSDAVIGIDTNIEVIVVSLTTWEAHHSPRANPEGFGELPRSLMRRQWPKLGYQFLFYHNENKLMMNKQILSI